MRFRDLTIGTRRVEPPPPGPTAAVADRGSAGWTAGARALGRGRRAMDFAVEPVGPSGVRNCDCRRLGKPSGGTWSSSSAIGAFGYRDIKDQPVTPVVKSWLSPAQQEWVEKHAPERLSLSNGRNAKVLYDAANPPLIALRIQELYRRERPRRASRWTACRCWFRFWRPTSRPVQITQDLARLLARALPSHQTGTPAQIP